MPKNIPIKHAETDKIKNSDIIFNFEAPMLIFIPISCFACDTAEDTLVATDILHTIKATQEIAKSIRKAISVILFILSLCPRKSEISIVEYKGQTALLFI